MKDLLKGTGLSFYVAIVAFILIAVIAFGTVLLKPAWLGLERKAFKASHQYIESKQTMLLNLAEKYEQLQVDIAKYSQDPESNQQIIVGLESQSSSLLIRIKTESQRIPLNELPVSVQNILY